MDGHVASEWETANPQLCMERGDRLRLNKHSRFESRIAFHRRDLHRLCVSGVVVSNEAGMTRQPCRPQVSAAPRSLTVAGIRLPGEKTERKEKAEDLFM